MCLYLFVNPWCSATGRGSYLRLTDIFTRAEVKNGAIHQERNRLQKSNICQLPIFTPCMLCVCGGVLVTGSHGGRGQVTNWAPLSVCYSPVESPVMDLGSAGIRRSTIVPKRFGTFEPAVQRAGNARHRTVSARWVTQGRCTIVSACSEGSLVDCDVRAEQTCRSLSCW